MRLARLTAIGVGCVLCTTAAAQSLPIKSIVAEPDRFVGQTVTVVGQFRGRNLFRDVPDPPGNARDGFVLRSGDAAVWIFGIRPRGRDFSLDPTRRGDAGLWLKVTGTVERGRNVVWISGRAVERASSDDDSIVEIAVALPPRRLEVVFSAPVAGEVDVLLTSRIRIQLSEVVDTATLRDRVRLTYSKAASVERGEPQPPTIAFAVNSAPDMRAIEIVPAAPLERFRELTVELLEGIRGKDGSVLQPWTLTFSTGGS